MPATAAPPRPEVVTGSRRPRTAAVALCGAAALLVLAVGTVWDSTTAGLSAPHLSSALSAALPDGGARRAVFGALAAVVAVLAVLLLARVRAAAARRSATRRDGPDGATLSRASVQEAPDPATDRAAKQATDRATDRAADQAPAHSRDLPPGTSRALAFQVRCLETALTEQEGVLQEVRAAAADAAREARHRERERVEVVLSALRELVADQPGAVAVQRIEAAVRRLGVDPTLRRPPLAAASPGSMQVGFAPPPPPGALPQGPVGQPAGQSPEPTTAESVEDVQGLCDDTSALPEGRDPSPEVVGPTTVAPAQAGPTSVPGPSKVLPVPAPPVPPAAPRRRRGLRRSAV